jgi:hypothetical protein
MKYTFSPIDIQYHNSNRYAKRPNIVLNFSLYSMCNDSYGIYLLLNLDLFSKSLMICIKPIGTLQLTKQ